MVTHAYGLNTVFAMPVESGLCCKPERSLPLMDAPGTQIGYPLGRRQTGQHANSVVANQAKEQECIVDAARQHLSMVCRDRVASNIQIFLVQLHSE
jgi:hypothetical protein